MRCNTCILLERLDNSVSNSPPQPGKVQIFHCQGTDKGKMPVGCLGVEGGGEIEAS